VALRSASWTEHEIGGGGSISSRRLPSSPLVSFMAARSSFGAPLWVTTHSYYYGPDYSVPHYEPPTVSGAFDSRPTPQTPGEIFCPDSGAYYLRCRMRGGLERVDTYGRARRRAGGGS